MSPERDGRGELQTYPSKTLQPQPFAGVTGPITSAVFIAFFP
jgi:hypothetical protein